MFRRLLKGILPAAAAIAQSLAMADGLSQPEEFNGVRVEAVEMAHDGNWPLPANRAAASLKLDANSTLALRFVKPGARAPGQPTAQWRALERALSELRKLATKFENLSRRASNLASVDVVQWQQENQRFGKALEAYLDLLHEPELQKIISKEEINNSRRQASRQKKSMYGPLGELLEGKRRDLIRNAERLGSNSAGDTVSVVAYVVPRSGQAQQIHVPEYDSIEAKPVAPFPRSSPILNEAEARQLRNEYEGAKVVSKAIGELVDKREQIGDQIQTLGRKLEDRARQFIRQARAIANAMDEARGTELLQVLAYAQTDEAKQFHNALAALKADVDMIRETGNDIEVLVKDFKSADALALLLAMQKASALSANVKTQLEKIPDLIAQWPKQLDTITRTAGLLAVEPVLQGRSDLLTSIEAIRSGVADDLRASGKALSDFLPEMRIAIGYVSDNEFTKMGGDAMSAVAAFDATNQLVAVNLDQVKDTEIDLRRSGMAIGGSIEVKVSFKAGANSAARDKTVTYAGESVLTGWHRRYSGDVIFTRAESGPGSDSFKPNAAVSREWHHFSRSEGKKFWNWLDPGLGFHAANLDQNQDQTVELGAGVNLSMWGGLIRAGYGYNLSVKEDRPYYWIGFGLFGMLNRLSDLPSFKP